MTDKTTDTDTGKQAEDGKKPFRVSTLVLLVLLILYVLAIVSYDAADLAVLEGGVDGLEQNLIGNVGAHIARAMFYLFGLAVYPCVGILILSMFRRLLPFPLRRQGYTGAMISVIAGFVLLFAMYPDRFLETSIRHGIGREMNPDLCLTGGVLGAAVAAPPVDGRDFQLDAGFLRLHIGEPGTLVIALALLLPGLFILFMQDWYPIMIHYAKAAWKKKLEAAGYTAPAPPPVVPEPAVQQEVKEEEEEKPSAPVRKKSAAVATLLRKAADYFAPAEEEEEEEETPSVPEPEESAGEEEDDYHVVPPAPLHNPSPAGGQAVNAANLYPDCVNGVPLDEEDDADDIPKQPPAPVAPAPTVSQFSQQQTQFDSEKPKGESTGNGKTAGSAIQCTNYDLPPVALLTKQQEAKNEDMGHIEESRNKIQHTLASFNVEGQVSNIEVGPRVTRFEVSLASGVKVEKVTSIQNNIAMDLAAESIRLLAPIPGKTAVGIEVPNKVSSIVGLRSLMESSAWRESKAAIPIILGRDIAGKVMTTDLAKAPHLLIAGSTGSGKSVCMNTLIMSLLFRFSPAELRLIMVDPKVVELEMYRPIPHLITPVVNDPKKVPLALRWGVNEMERRYRVLAKVKAKNLAAFNTRPPEPVPVLDENNEVIPQTLPLIIIIIDELADIMMTDAKSDVETSICRIAQKGRAAGIHLVIATQTPRKDIITGLIKANLPTKIAFRVGSNMDSRVILDTGGAEKLLGSGDMLFLPPGGAGMERIQGSWVSDSEIQKVVDVVSSQVEQHFDAQVIAEDVEVHNSADADDEPPRRSGAVRKGSVYDPQDADIEDVMQEIEMENSIASKYLMPGDSDLLRKALEIIISEQKASTSYLQRRLGIGYNKSAELMDQLEQRGIISAPLPGGQKREILITAGLETNQE